MKKIYMNIKINIKIGKILFRLSNLIEILVRFFKVFNQFPTLSIIILFIHIHFHTHLYNYYFISLSYKIIHK